MARKPTIWEALAARLGRAPTNAEANAEARRILREGHEAELIARAERGTPPHQRNRASN
jgi:hypothetical protein